MSVVIRYTQPRHVTIESFDEETVSPFSLPSGLGLRSVAQ